MLSRDWICMYDFTEHTRAMFIVKRNTLESLTHKNNCAILLRKSVWWEATWNLRHPYTCRIYVFISFSVVISNSNFLCYYSVQTKKSVKIRYNILVLHWIRSQRLDISWITEEFHHMVFLAGVRLMRNAEDCEVFFLGKYSHWQVGGIENN